ncbi:hypothetical protein [Nostoc sp.]
MSERTVLRGCLAIAPHHNPQTLLKSMYQIYQLPCLAKDLVKVNPQK